MKEIAFLLLFLWAEAGAASAVEGHWFFYKKIYQKQEIPEPPGATLRMHFEFSPAGESSLYWWHEGEGDYCRRTGKYAVDGGHIVDEVTWVDPRNSKHCGQDPDMQLGRRTRSSFYFHGPDLAIRFHLGDEPLDLVWKKIEGERK
jgi:hypothetical protein